MNHLFLTTMVITALVCLSSCQKDDLQISNSENTTLESSAKSKGGNDKIDVCHKGKTINISINAVSTHQSGHGDAVDMDGDGYFNIDCDCGPTDCDDTESSLTDDCCAAELIFCEYIDRLDFDEPCEEYYHYGDYYCANEGSWDYGNYYYCGHPYFGTWGRSTIYDHDYYSYYCDNDTNDEYDYGYVHAYWQNYHYCGTEYFYGYIGVYYYNYNSGDYIHKYFQEYTEEAYNKAISGGTAIDEIAANWQMTNVCSSGKSAAASSNAKAFNGKKLSHQELLQLNRPDLEANMPEEMKEMLPKIEK